MLVYGSCSGIQACVHMIHLFSLSGELDPLYYFLFLNFVWRITLTII